MCVAHPARVLSVEDGYACVTTDGHPELVSTIVLGDPGPAPGEWLLIQAGFAVAVLDEAEAAERRRLLEQVREV